MEQPLNITALNDFVFCPVSIYFHGLYGSMEKMLYQTSAQTQGAEAHRSIDRKTYSTSTDILQGIDVYCEKYYLIGKIDLFYQSSGILIERKKKVKQIYDGYIWQLYAQYFCLSEMGYMVNKLRIHSLDDNKTYEVPLPEEKPDLRRRFEKCIEEIQSFDMTTFIQTNAKKCTHCIYEPYCDRSKL